MLNSTQLAALKADIALDGALSVLPNNGDGNATVATAYNALASPDFLVWDTKASVSAILDSLTWTNFTPVDTVSVADATLTFADRLLVIQTKQMNLQTMLQGRDKIDASKANIRAGLRDAVISLPAGAGGAAVSAGGASGATLLTACLRKATRAEKLLNVGSATTGSTTGNLLGFEGNITAQDVNSALNLP